MSETWIVGLATLFLTVIFVALEVYIATHPQHCSVTFR